MDSNKRLAGLMTMSNSKPAEGLDSKADISDAGFMKMDATAAMANTASNFGAGIDKVAM